MRRESDGGLHYCMFIVVNWSHMRTHTHTQVRKELEKADDTCLPLLGTSVKVKCVSQSWLHGGVWSGGLADSRWPLASVHSNLATKQPGARTRRSFQMRTVDVVISRGNEGKSYPQSAVKN